jgi:L,D-transpeptidase catalytic domain
MGLPTRTFGPLAAAVLALLPAGGPHAQGFQSVSGAMRPPVAAVPSPTPQDARAHFESVGASGAGMKAPAQVPLPVQAEAAPPASEPAGAVANLPVDTSAAEGAVAAAPGSGANEPAQPAAGLPTLGQPLPSALPFSSVSAPAAGRSGTASGAGPMLPGPEDGPGSSFDLADRIVIEKAARRLYLLRGDDVLVEYPVRLGLNPYGHKQREGDFRTPEGTYYLSRRNPRSEFFLSVEVSYPNEADRARARQAGVRPGGLIMIHGQPNVPRKAPDYYANNDWTDGCIAVSNPDMVDIWLRTRVGTPIEIKP